MSNDIRKYLDVISATPEKIKSVLLEGMNDADLDWFKTSTNEMISRVRAGEFPVNVINSIAREYSWKHAGTYESFTFARDALERRAWEMGLTGDDLPEEDKNTSFHSALVGDEFAVPEPEEDSELEEIIMREGWLDNIYNALAPEHAASMVSKNQMKSIANKLSTKFYSQFGYKKDEALNKTIVEKFLKQLKYDPEFISDTISEFKKKFPTINFDGQLSKTDMNQLFVAIASGIVDEGGEENVTRGIYKSYEKDDKPAAKTTKPDAKTAPKPKTAPATRSSEDLKTAKLTSMGNIEAAIKKAESGQPLTDIEIKDMAKLMRKFGIPAIKAQLGK